MIKKTRTYSTAFKAEAVKKIADNNDNVSAAAKQPDIAMQTLSNWQNKAREGCRILSACRVSGSTGAVQL